MKRTRLAVVVSLVTIVLIGAGIVVRLRGARPAVVAARPVVPEAQRAPDGVRVRLEVLNATRIRGLARRATALLRDHGFDVVENGTSSEAHDTTVVIDLTGHPEWAARVAASVAPARVVSRPDTSRYLDISVLLGTTWRAPPSTLYP